MPGADCPRGYDYSIASGVCERAGSPSLPPIWPEAEWRPEAATLLNSRNLRTRVTRNWEDASLAGLHELSRLIRQMEDSLQRVALDMASRRQDTGAVSAEIRSLKTAAVQVGTAIRMRAQESRPATEGPPGSEPSVTPSRLPWVVGGVVLLWWLLKGRK